MQKNILGKWIFTVITSLFLSLATQVRADATVYWDSDEGFNPSTVVVGPEGKVTWWNMDIYNFPLTVTFSGGFNFSLDQYEGMEVTFPSQTGVYSYSSEWGDYGSVIVNTAPTVAITAPANNATFEAPATFTIQATAGDTADDSVSDVEFFLGTSDSTNSIEDVISAPYTTGVTNLAAGTYTLIAVARDSRGWTATDAITVTVTGGAAVTLDSPRLDGGKFIFDVNGLTTGKTNVLQISTNLVSWDSVKTNIAATASATVTNIATAARQFYRIFQLP
jgi:plastocyanin